MRLPVTARARIALALFLAGCGEDQGMNPKPPPLHTTEVTARDPGPCGGTCSEAELCVRDAAGKYGCARICANQFHCWSGCCLALKDTGYNVCRPNEYCFAR
jgi:hypothetical protein